MGKVSEEQKTTDLPVCVLGIIGAGDIVLAQNEGCRTRADDAMSCCDRPLGGDEGARAVSKLPVWAES